MPFWPSTVSQYALEGTLQEVPERNVSEFKPEVGPPKTRRRTSIGIMSISFETRLTFDAWDDLFEFYTDDLKDGSLSFTRKHPRDLSGRDYTYMFASVPQFRDEGYNFGRASISLIKLPS